MESSAQLTPEREAELAKAFGLEEMPRSRYDDLPKLSIDDLGRKVRFSKALTLVDPLASAAFEGYLPSRLSIDQAIDPRSFCPNWSFVVHVDPTARIVVNPKVTAATGIGAQPNERNHYLMLAQKILWLYDEAGARKMSPTLVFRTNQKNRKAGVVPMLGVIFKLDRTPPDGRRMEDMVASVGILTEPGTVSKNKVQVVADGVASQNPDGSFGDGAVRNS